MALQVLVGLAVEAQHEDKKGEYMSVIAERIKKRSYEDKLLEIYSQKETILEVLKCAYAQEEHFRRGAYLNSGTVKVQADRDEKSGRWEVVIDVDHGKVVYTALDDDSYNVNIYSIPNTKYIKNKENLSEAELKMIQVQASNSIDINLKDTKTLRKAKDLFKNDYVLKHISLHHLDADNAARFLIWHIRAYRKVFLDYQKKYKFLWEDTSFKSATQIVNAMATRGLKDQAFFSYDFDPSEQRNPVLDELSEAH